MIASRLAGMRPPYPRYPLREFTPCAPGRSIQQYFPVSSGTGSRIQFLQCNFHPRRPTGITTDSTDLTDNVRIMPLQKPPTVSASSVKSVVFFCLRINRNGKKPPRRARSKAPVRIFHHNDTKTRRGLGVRSYHQWFQARRESMIKLAGSAVILMSSRFQVLASRFHPDVPGHLPFSNRCSVTPSPHLCFLLVNTKRFSPQRHKDTKSI